MGGNLDDFYNVSMYDFQSKMAAYRLTLGIQEEEISTTDDLDQLYSKIDAGALNDS